MQEAYRQFLRAGEQAGMRYVLDIPREAMRGATGVQTGHGAGSSLDFKDYREYQPGDDLRRIDWSAFGRSDRLIIKLFREEVTPHVDILLDGSRSMALPESRKSEAALGLSALFASAASNARCSHRAWIGGEGFREVANGSREPSVWGAIDFDATQTPAEAYYRMSPRMKRYGIRILISDLMWEDEPMNLLRPLCDGAAAVFVVQLLALPDREITEHGNARLEDIESDGALDVFLDPIAQRRYGEALSRHQQQWRRACRRAGAAMVTLNAEDLLDGWQPEALQRARFLVAA
ncbi:MAG: DUF58 domain-containing protein [Verrucomicrobiota bacterium]